MKTLAVWEFLAALKTFVADGCATVSSEQYAERLLICQQCEYRDGPACQLCGCRLSLKAQARAWECPIQKWPAINPHQPTAEPEHEHPG